MKGNQNIIYHPKDTVNFWKEEIRKEKKPDNLWYSVNYFQQMSLEENSLKRLVSLDKSIEPSSTTVEFLKEIAENRTTAFLYLSETHLIKKLKGHLKGKIIHGIGGGHIRETAITLHPVYGIPYIPSSSLKGTVRSWVIQAYFSGNEELLIKDNGQLDERGLKIKNLARLIFGTQENRGKVEFHDVFFPNDFKLTPDVMTVHFSNYYNGKGAKSPTDNQNTIPINFYTLEVKESDIYLSISKNEKDYEYLLNVASIWTEKALTEIGIGSKTSSGYGIFANVTDQTEEFLKKITELKEKKEKEREQKRKLAEELARKLKEEQESAAREARRATMNDGEKLADDIAQLSDKKEDIEKSKNTIYRSILELSFENGKKEAANALKNYWQKTGNWNAKDINKKQKEKVYEIKKILEEV